MNLLILEAIYFRIFVHVAQIFAMVLLSSPQRINEISNISDYLFWEQFYFRVNGFRCKSLWRMQLKKEARTVRPSV